MANQVVLQLCSQELLHIASYLTSKNGVDSLADFSVDDSDEEQPVSYSDIEAESEDDAHQMASEERDFSVDEDDSDEESDDDADRYDDGVAFDNYMERRRERQGDRYFRQQDADQSRSERRQRADERKEQLRLARSRAKEDARDVVAMAGVCSAWRREICYEQPGDNSCGELLWKPLYRKMFHSSMTGLCDGNALEKKGCTFFSMFELMVKIENLQGNETITTKDAASDAKKTLKEANLEDVMVAMKFGYDGQYGKRCFMGIGGMNCEQVVDVNVPHFGRLCENKRLKWWKEAQSICDKRTTTTKRKQNALHGYSQGFHEYDDNDSENSDDSERWDKNSDDLIWTRRAEERSSFPTADIFAILPPSHGAGEPGEKEDTTSSEPHSSKTFRVVKIYHGKPKWKRCDTSEYDEYFEYGPEVEEEDIMAHLFGSKYLTAGYNSVMVVHHEPIGVYSEEQVEYLKENYEEEEDYYDDAEKMIKMRKEDVMEFLLGSNLHCGIRVHDLLACPLPPLVLTPQMTARIQSHLSRVQP